MTPTPRAWLMAYPGDDPSTDWCTMGPKEPEPDDDGVTVALFDQDAIDSAVAAERKCMLLVVEQRLRTWRQRTMNRSGDRLALDDFMGPESIDDLIDSVCNEWD